MKSISIVVVTLVAVLQIIQCAPPATNQLDGSPAYGNFKKSINSQQFVDDFLKLGFHFYDDKRSTIESLLYRALENIDQLMATAVNDDRKTKNYANVRQNVMDYMKAIEYDMKMCGLGLIAASETERISDLIFDFDDKQLDALWQQSKEAQFKIFDTDACRSGADLLPDNIFDEDEDLRKDFELSVMYILHKRCKDYDKESYERFC